MKKILSIIFLLGLTNQISAADLKEDAELHDSNKDAFSLSGIKLKDLTKSDKRLLSVYLINEIAGIQYSKENDLKMSTDYKKRSENCFKLLTDDLKKLIDSIKSEGALKNDAEAIYASYLTFFN